MSMFSEQPGGLWSDMPGVLLPVGGDRPQSPRPPSAVVPPPAARPPQPLPGQPGSPFKISLPWGMAPLDIKALIEAQMQQAMLYQPPTTASADWLKGFKSLSVAPKQEPERD